MRNLQSGFSADLKRLLDVLGAALGLIILGPLMLTVALLIRVNLGSPVLFRQIRPGRHGRLFELVKFRTMADARDEKGRLLPDAQRLTEFGQLLRSTSLDELPQLWNVLRGELSLVGPRPLMVRYLSRYSPRQTRRHEVMPGVTGWSQINGRNAISWDEKLELDVWYVDHWSLGLDLKILMMTLRRVFNRTGVSSPGHATMPEFQGNADIGRSP